MKRFTILFTLICLLNACSHVKSSRENDSVLHISNKSAVYIMISDDEIKKILISIGLIVYLKQTNESRKIRTPPKTKASEIRNKLFFKLKG